MSKLSEIVYNIKNLSGRGEHTDDQKLGDRQLEFIVDHFRAEIASQRANNNKSIDGFYQELTDLKLVTTKEFKPYNLDVTILKSMTQLPSLVTSHDVGFIIQFVGLRDEFMGFQQSSVHTYNIDLESPYVQSVYFIVGGYLYIATKVSTFIREILVRGIFSNPRDVVELSSDFNILSGLDWDYPIPGNLIGSLNNMILNNEYKWMHILKPDNINDSKDA